MVHPIARRRVTSRPGLPKALKYSAAVMFGVAIGAFFTSINTIDSKDHVSSLVLQESVMQTTHNGFHPIHVYYGSEDAIKGLSASSLQMKQHYNAGSQVDQDKIISALVSLYATKESSHIPHAPFFIDLAANDAVQLSNTLYLEKVGWQGICIEPNPIYWYRLAHRKCTVAAAFVGAEDMQQVDVSLQNEEYGGIVAAGMDNKVSKRSKTTEKRYTISLKTLFQEFHVPQTVDYLSLDVEGAEHLIMKDFPFAAYAIRFITIERPKPDLQKLLKANGYIFVMQLIFWGETLWVHESVLQTLSMDEIQQSVRKTSKYPAQVPGKNALVFDLKTGVYSVAS